jgi:hypothetical protein
MARTPETLAFAERLKQALRRLPKRVKGPAELAIQFNLNYSGERVTNQAVQKWLVGDNLPTVEKIRTLAKMCDVPLEWLHHGAQVYQPESAPLRIAQPSKTYEGPLSEAEMQLVTSFRQLSADQKILVQNLIDHLTFSRKVWVATTTDGMSSRS